MPPAACRGSALSPGRRAPSQVQGERGVRERPTQIIIEVPDSRSACESTESWCSGVPATTLVSQVPHQPSSQDEEVPGSAARTTSSSDRSGGTRRTFPLRRSSTSKPPDGVRSAAPGVGGAPKRSVCSGPLHRSSTARSSPGGPQQ